MGPQNLHRSELLTVVEEEEFSEEGTISHASSLEKLTPTLLGDGMAEQKFRVDRRKLEVMISGNEADPCDVALMKLPLRRDGKAMPAEEFFQKIMEKTKTEIKYPKFLKVGARNKKDPHVRVIGEPEAVRIAGAMVRHELEPLCKVTMKLDVSWVHHSHIIGKGGITIQPVVKRTGVSIHFPDGNKSSEVSKSNQVSVNSRGEDLSGLEIARSCIRDLTPLVFSFTLSPSAQFVSVSDPTVLIQHVQTTFNVQAELKVTEDMTPVILGTVRGNEWEALRVKEATLCILQAYCDNLAKQIPVQVSLEISPQHHAFVLGRANETLKSIMQRTSTKISFPDANDASIPPLKKSTVTISGAIDNVYTARQNIIGALPLVLMFELMPDQDVDSNEVRQIMQTWDVNIFLKSKKTDGRRLVVIKGAEKNADNIYEAWRLVSQTDKEPPKARIPPSYHIPESDNLQGIGVSLTDLNLGHWMGGSKEASPCPTPTPTQVQSSFIWDRYQPTYCSQISPCPQQPLYGAIVDPISSYYANNFLQPNTSLDCYNNNCPMPKSSEMIGPNSAMTFNNLLTGMSLPNNDASCGNTSPSGSSLSSPGPSPQDPSQDPLMGSHSSVQFRDLDQSGNSGIKAVSVMMSDIERRAPGCEKKLIELEHQKYMGMSDYNSMKLQAAMAMKEQVAAGPRTPTSNWSGYGFSKSMPDYMIRQQMQNKLQASQQRDDLEKWEGWQTGDSKADYLSRQGLPSAAYSSQLSQMSTNFGSSGGSTIVSQRQRPSSNLSASNIMDCVLPRPTKTLTSPSQLDINSILTDIQLEQYIDVFAAHDVDLNMFLTLNGTDLKELGIKIFGHRKRILMVIKDLSSKLPFYTGNVNPELESPVTLEVPSGWK